MNGKLIDRYSLPAKVAILYSEVKRKYFASYNQYLTEKDSRKEAGVVAKYLKRAGISYKLIEADQNIFQAIKDDQPQILLNMVGSIKGKEYLAALIPGIAEAYQIPCSGAGFLAEAQAYNKYYIKRLLLENGVPVPYYFLINSPDSLPKNIPYPCMVKLNSIHGSVEITKKAFCQNYQQLKKRVAFLWKRYHDSILVEEFIEGEEFTVVGFEYQRLRIYIAKNIFGDNNNPRSFASFDAQWNDEEIIFRKYKDLKLAKLAEKGFRAANMRDYGKFDVRKDKNGDYYFIDANTNPALGPKESDCAMATVMDLYGITFDEILKMLFTNVWQRHRKRLV